MFEIPFRRRRHKDSRRPFYKPALEVQEGRFAPATFIVINNLDSGPGYHLKAVLDAQQRLWGAGHLDTLATRLELGATRLQQKRYAEAEPLLLAAFAGLREHESTSPPTKGRVAEALQKLVQLYAGWGKNDEAEEWRRKLEEQKK